MQIWHKTCVFHMKRRHVCTAYLRVWVRRRCLRLQTHCGHNNASCDASTWVMEMCGVRNNHPHLHLQTHVLCALLLLASCAWLPSGRLMGASAVAQAQHRPAAESSGAVWQAQSGTIEATFQLAHDLFLCIIDFHWWQSPTPYYDR